MSSPEIIALKMQALMSLGKKAVVQVDKRHAIFWAASKQELKIDVEKEPDKWLIIKDNAPFKWQSFPDLTEEAESNILELVNAYRAALRGIFDQLWEAV